MAHDQSIAQALSILHIQEETKGQKETHYYSFWEMV